MGKFVVEREKKEKNQINLSCIEICVKITTETGSKPSQYKKLGKVKKEFPAARNKQPFC